MIANAATMHAMTNNNGSSSAPSVTSYTLNDNLEISSTVTAEMQWVVTKDVNNFQFQVSGTSNYLYCTNANNGVRVGTNKNNVFTITKDNTAHKTYQQLKNSATSRYVGEYNNQDWRCYTSATASNIIECNTVFFKKVSGGSTDETVATPTFSPAAGTYYEAQSVTLSCSTPGSTIHYTTDGTNPTTESTVFSGAIPVSETTTIKAIATADGMDPSPVASATYTIELPTTVANIEEFKLLNKGDTFVFTGDVVVTYFNNASNNYVWIKDNTGYALLYQSGLTPSQGDVIKGGWHGEKDVYKGLEEIKNVTGATIDGSETVNPVELEVSDITVENQSTYGWLRGVSITPGNGQNFTIGSGVAGYNTYGIDLTNINSASTYNILGLVNVYNNAQFTPVQIEEVQVTKYTVTCNTAENGSISTDESEYAEGATVNVTVTPADGYELATLVYNDGEDHDIKDAKSFTMPASNVTVTATFSKVGDLYIMGMINGNGEYSTRAVKMGFDGTNYTAKIWVIGNSDNAMGQAGSWMAFTTVLANDNNDGGWSYVNSNRYSPSPDNGDYYWLTNGTETDIRLTKQNNDKAFLIPAGLYEVTVNKNLTSFSLVTVKDLTPVINPNGGDVALNSTATVSIGEDFNAFIAECNDVVYANGTVVNDITAPVAKFYLNNELVNGTSTDYEFTTTGAVTLTGKCTLDSNGEYATKTATATFNVTEVDMSNVYTLVESANDLVAGGEYIIVGSTNDAPYSAILGAMAGSGATYANAINENFTYDATAKTITLNEGCTATPLVLGGESGAWTFNNGSGYIAYTSSTTSTTGTNNLWLLSDVSAKGTTWNIQTDKLPSNNELIQNNFNSIRHIRYNSQGTRFAGYGSGQSAVALFKKATATTPKSDDPVITPASQDVKGGLLEDVTITAAEGATIYYTTDGSDPSDETNTNRAQYTEPFDIQVAQGGPKTVKAIAIEAGKDPSNVVSVQYMFKNPDAPTFTPDPAVVQTGDFTITINSADGGVIYYVLDPDANEFPSNSEEAIATGQVYADVVAVSGTGEHKIYAAVVLNGLKSTLSTATYTVIETGAEGDWKLVENTDDIQAGRDYIIVNSDRDRAIKSGDLETSRFYSTPCEGHVVFGPNFATATVAGTDVRVFSFEAENGKMYMKDSGTSQYYNLSSNVSTGKTPVEISMSDGFVYINGEGGTKKLAYNTAYGNYFGMYANPTTNGNQRPIYMYYRGTETPEYTEVTLAELCATGVTTEGSNKYVISDRLVAVYADDVKGILWCKDEDNVSIFPTSIKEGQVDFLKNDSQAQNGRDWDQSNWIALQFSDPNATNNIGLLVKNAVNHYIKPGTIKGTYTDDVNYTLTMDLDQLELVTPADEGGNVQPDYIPNVYCTSNFLPTNLNIWGNEEDGGYTTGSDQNYFFMNPKIQEVCEITYAQWDDFNKCFTVPTKSGFDGAVYVGWGYNVLGNLSSSLQDEHVYKFQAIVQRSDKNSYGPKNVTTPFAGFTVYPVDLDGTGSDITTAINTVEAGKGEVKSVKYVNVAGVVSDAPFQGVNIVVTEYTDGSRTTSKMLRK